MFRFSVGDRVSCVVDNAAESPDLSVGSTGEVVVVDGDYTPPVGVRWDNYNSSFHSLDGHCELGHGWFVYEHEIELLSEEEIETATDDELSALLFGKED